MTKNKTTARAAAARLLAARQYSIAGMTGKLTERGFDEDEINAVIEDFIELGYLDDLRFARSIVKHYGDKETKRIRFELYKRGIDRETGTEALEEFWESMGDGDCEQL